MNKELKEKICNMLEAYTNDLDMLWQHTDSVVIADHYRKQQFEITKLVLEITLSCTK